VHNFSKSVCLRIRLETQQAWLNRQWKKPCHPLRLFVAPPCPRRMQSYATLTVPNDQREKETNQRYGNLVDKIEEDVS
jgi:hypothetical protein